MKEKSTFGKFIQQKRKELNITQKELADALYVTESAVSKWERGVSYPDITLVSSICEVLEITEHELVTSSEDYKQREIEGQAKKYKRILNTYKWAFISIYAITIITCFICNLAIFHTLSWFWVVVASIAVAFSFTSVPVLVQKNKGIWTLVSFFISLNILFFACFIYVGGTWLLPTIASVLFGFSMMFLPYFLYKFGQVSFITTNKALIYFAVNSILLYVMELVILLTFREPFASFKTAFAVTTYVLIFVWACMLIIRYAPINKFYKTASCVFLTGILTYTCNSVIDTLIDGVPLRLLPINFGNWYDDIYLNGNITFLVFLVFAFVGIIFVIAGVIHQSKNRKTI